MALLNPRLEQPERFPQQPPCTISKYRPFVETASANDAATKFVVRGFGNNDQAVSGDVLDAVFANMVEVRLQF